MGNPARTYTRPYYSPGSPGMQQGTLVYTIITYNSVYFIPYVFLPLRLHII